MIASSLLWKSDDALGIAYIYVHYWVCTLSLSIDPFCAELKVIFSVVLRAKLYIYIYVCMHVYSNSIVSCALSSTIVICLSI